MTTEIQNTHNLRFRKDHHTDASVDGALRELDVTKKNGVSGDEMDKLISSTSDYGQVTEREYSQARRWVVGNWDTLSDEAKQKWQKFDAAMQNAGGIGTSEKHHSKAETVLVSGPQLDDLIKDINAIGRPAPPPEGQGDGVEHAPPANEPSVAAPPSSPFKPLAWLPPNTADDIKGFVNIFKDYVANHSKDSSMQGSIDLMNQFLKTDGKIPADILAIGINTSKDGGGMSATEYHDLKEWTKHNWDSLDPAAQKAWNQLEAEVKAKNGGVEPSKSGGEAIVLTKQQLETFTQNIDIGGAPQTRRGSGSTTGTHASESSGGSPTGGAAGTEGAGGSRGTAGTGGTAQAGGASSSGNSLIDAAGGAFERMAGIEDRMASLDPSSPTYQRDLMQLQREYDQLKQFVELLNQMQKSKHEMLMSIIRNIGA